MLSDPPLQPGPLYAFPLFGLLALAIAAVSLGIARGALDDLIALAGGKVPTGGQRTLAERGDRAGGGRARRGRGARRRRAARRGDRRGLGARRRRRGRRRRAAGGACGSPPRTRPRSAPSATDTAYTLAGGSAIYESSPLQRRLRDAHAATQHMLVAPATWELTGRVLLGMPTDATQL